MRRSVLYLLPLGVLVLAVLLLTLARLAAFPADCDPEWSVRVISGAEYVCGEL